MVYNPLAVNIKLVYHRGVFGIIVKYIQNLQNLLACVEAAHRGQKGERRLALFRSPPPPLALNLRIYAFGEDDAN